MRQFIWHAGDDRRWVDIEKALLMSAYSFMTLPDGTTLGWNWVAEWMTDEFERRGISPLRNFHGELLRRFVSRHKEVLVQEWDTDGFRANVFIQNTDTMHAQQNPGTPTPRLNALLDPNHPTNRAMQEPRPQQNLDRPPREDDDEPVELALTP